MGLLGPSEGQTLVEWVQETNIATPFGGQPIAPSQITGQTANIATNKLIDGSMESWSAGTTSVPDGWGSGGAGATFARNTTNVQDGLSACDLTAALNVATSLSQTLSLSGTVNTRLRGAVVTFSAWVLASVANRVFLQLGDGITLTNSVTHLGDGVYRLLSVTMTLSSVATSLSASLNISAGASMTATIDAAMVNEGAIVAAFSPHPRDSSLLSQEVSQQVGTDTFIGLTDVPSLVINNVIVDGQQSVLILFQISTQNNTADVNNNYFVYKDGAQLKEALNFLLRVANTAQTAVQAMYDVKPAAGSHSYKIRASASAGTGTNNGRRMQVIIIPSV